MPDNKVGEAFVELRYRLDKLAGDMRGVERQVAGHTQGLQRTISGGFSRLGQVVAAPFRQLGGMMGSLQGQIGTLAGAMGGISIGAGIVQTNVEFERLGAVLKTVTGSVTAGKSAFAELEKFAATTPFSLEQAVTAFTRLKALGIEPTTDRLRAFGNVSAAMGTDLMQFVEAVADAATGEFERLKEFGIKASAQGDQVSFTFQGVTKTVGKNAAEITAYLESIGKVNFAGAMADQAGSLPGLFSNLGDAAAGFARQIGEAGLNQGLKDISLSLLGIGDAAKPLAETLGGLAGGALGRLAESLKGALGWFNNLSPSMQEFTVKAVAFGGAITVALPALAILIASVGALATPLGAAAIGLAAAGAAFVTFDKEIGSFLAGSWRNIQRDFALVQTAAVEFGGAFKQVAKNILSSLGIVPQGVTDALGNLSQAIGGALGGAMATARDAGGRLASAISAALGTGDYSGAFKGLAEGVRGALGGALQAARDFGAPFRETLSLAFSGDLLGAFSRIADPVRQGLDAALATARGFGESMRAALGFEVAPTGGGLAGFVGMVQDGLGRALESARGFGASFNEIMGSIGPPAEGSALDRFDDAVMAMRDNVIAALGNMAGGIGQALAAADEPIRNLGLGIGQVAGTIQDTLNVALTVSRTFGGELRTLFEAPLNASLEAARSFGSGFREAFAAAFSIDVAAALGRMTAPIGEGLAAATAAAGRFGEGVRAAFGLPLQAAQALGDAIGLMADVVVQAIERVIEAARSFGADMKASLSGITAPVAAIKEAFAATATGSIAEMRRLAGGVQEWLSKPWDLSGIKGNVDAVKGFFQGLYMSVVGGSIVPDMVNETGGWFERLGPLIVAPVERATANVTAAFQKMKEQANLDEYLAKFKEIEAEAAAANVGPAPATAAAVPAAMQAAPATAAKPAAGGASDGEAEARRAKIADMRFELDALQRLTAAQAQGAAAGERMRVQIEAERAARELGAKATAAQRAEVSRLTAALAEQEGAGQRAAAINALKVEIDELTRLTAAQGQSEAASRAMERQIEAERAARALGATATETERQAVMRLTLAKLEQAAALDKAVQARQAEAARMADYNARFKEIEADVVPANEPAAIQGPRFDIGEAGRQAMAGANDALRTYVENATNYGRMAGEAIAGGLQVAEDALVGFAMKGELSMKSLKEVAADFAEQMLRMAIRQGMAMMIMGMGLGGPAPATAGAGAGGGGFARGGAFRFGRVEPFARGGIVNKPTIFPMARGAGLMGESGPEAIMPLKRTTGGKLGVEVANDNPRRGGGDVTVNVVNNGAVPAENVSTRETTGPDGGRVIEVMIERAVGRQLAQGRHDRIMGERYGAKPRGR